MGAGATRAMIGHEVEETAIRFVDARNLDDLFAK